MNKVIPTPPSNRGHHMADDGHLGMDCAPIYIVTGGPGASGQQILHGVLAQFPTKNVPIENITHAQTHEDIEDAVRRAAADDSFIMHTLVVRDLRQYLKKLAAELGVVEFDIMGDLMDHLRGVLDVEPLEEPARYYINHAAFFERVDAIEYTLDKDDGKEVDGWEDAEIMLVGVSRSGKTPLSVYLADHGWKVANYPLVMGMAPPPELFTLDRRRVFGLDIEFDMLMEYRRQRQSSMGAPLGAIGYTDPLMIANELEFARDLFKKGRFTVVDVTRKPVESIALEVVKKLRRRFGDSDKINLSLA